MTHLILLIVAFFLASLCVLGLLLLFLTKPNRHRPEVEPFTRVLYAHRGLHSGSAVPENSMEAFRLAVEQGYAIELDVQLSRDGVPVVFHDNTLDRVCGIRGTVSAFTAERLTSFSLLGNPDAHIPTLSQVLELVAGRVPLLIEIKGELPGWRRTVRAAAALLDSYAGPYCVESFHPLILRYLRKTRPHVVRGQLSASFLREPGYRGFKYALLSGFLLNFLSKPDFIAYCFLHRNARPLCMLRHLWGVPLFAWTARSREDQEICRTGFDTTIFETFRPERRRV